MYIEYLKCKTKIENFEFVEIDDAILLIREFFNSNDFLYKDQKLNDQKRVNKATISILLF